MLDKMPGLWYYNYRKSKEDKKMEKIQYRDYFFVEGKPVTEIRTSKVYGEYFQRMPSGLRKMLKVWNTRTGSMVSIKAEMVI